MTLVSQIESILFVASKPLSTKQLTKAVGFSASEVEDALETLVMKYNTDDSGIHIFREVDMVQMGTNPVNSEAIDSFIKNDVTGELTKAQLETLTVIAYRSPITRSDLEQIRGVNCSVILRNLIMRGLVLQHDSSDEILPTYILSPDALSHLGVRETSELPAYSELHEHEHIAGALVNAE